MRLVGQWVSQYERLLKWKRLAITANDSNDKPLKLVAVWYSATVVSSRGDDYELAFGYVPSIARNDLFCQGNSQIDAKLAAEQAELFEVRSHVAGG
jgi:hypothetical protein